MIQIRRDGHNQPFIQWQQSGEGWKRAWIQHKTGEVDWAGTGRYLNVVRAVGPDGNPNGNPTDFPIWCDLEDEQVLEAFVAAVCGITGCPLPAD